MNETVTVDKLAEAHLMNVQRQIAQMNEQKSQLDVEIQKLTDYFNTGVDALRSAKSEAKSESTSVGTNLLG